MSSLTGYRIIPSSAKRAAAGIFRGSSGWRSCCNCRRSSIALRMRRTRSPSSRTVWLCNSFHPQPCAHASAAPAKAPSRSG
eukprot:scaffold438_cov250-Pinguiococcus_pyrenoidosus.AAC.22